MAVAAAYLHDDTFDGAAQLGHSQGLAAAFEMGWATADTKVELLLVNWDGDLLGAGERGGGKLLATLQFPQAVRALGCPFACQRTPDNLAALAGTARRVAVASAQTKWMSALGLM